LNARARLEAAVPGTKHILESDVEIQPRRRAQGLLLRVTKHPAARLAMPVKSATN
jgi:hypothetical protein